MWHTAISTYCILSPHPHSDPGVLWIGCGWSASCNWHVFKMNHSGPHKMSSNDHRWSCYAFFWKGHFCFCYCFVNKVIMIPVLHHLYLLLTFESMLRPLTDCLLCLILLFLEVNPLVFFQLMSYYIHSIKRILDSGHKQEHFCHFCVKRFM